MDLHIEVTHHQIILTINQREHRLSILIGNQDPATAVHRRNCRVISLMRDHGYGVAAQAAAVELVNEKIYQAKRGRVR